jgi:trk system potassium uptake protein TrkA
MKTVAVIGLGQFGYQLSINLTHKGFNVIAIDSNLEVIDEIKELVHQAIVVDSMEESAMRAINIDSVDLAIVAIGSNVQSSLLTTALLQRMNVDEIYVRAIEPLQESILRSMGIQNILNIEKEMGMQLANTLSSDVGRYIQISDRHSLMEVKVPSLLVGKTLQELDLRTTYKINIVGIKTALPKITDDGDISYELRMTDIPDPNYPLNEHDILVIAGTDAKLNRFVSLGNKRDH